MKNESDNASAFIKKMKAEVDKAKKQVTDAKTKKDENLDIITAQSNAVVAYFTEEIKAREEQNKHVLAEYNERKKYRA